HEVLLRFPTQLVIVALVFQRFVWEECCSLAPSPWEGHLEGGYHESFRLLAMMFLRENHSPMKMAWCWEK
ncbi:MAG: hypothetical protein ABGW78_15625, partial [Pirellulales bacterium]